MMKSEGDDEAVMGARGGAFLPAGLPANNDDNDDGGGGGGRVYVAPPRPRSHAGQAVLWSAGYMRPFGPPGPGGRNVECCIPMVGRDGVLRPCGATLKHTMGASTTNLLKHIKVKHPKEADHCLEGSKHSGVYQSKAAIQQDTVTDTSSAGGNHNDNTITDEIRQAAGQAADRNTAVPPSTSAKRPPRKATAASRDALSDAVLYCALDLHPARALSDPGLQHLLRTHVGPPPPRLTSDLFSEALERERQQLKGTMRELLDQQRRFIPHGPCCSLQVESWTEPSTAHVYVVTSVSFVNLDFKWQRFGLSVAAMPEVYSLGALEQLVRDTTAEYFGSDVQPSDVYVACTVGAGQHLPALAESLGLEGLPCVLRLLDTQVRDALAGNRGSNTASVSDLVDRMMRAGGHFTRPAAETTGSASAHLAVQQGLRNIVLHTTSDPSLQNILELMKRFLHIREPLIRCCTSGGPTAGAPCDALGEGDWRMAQDAVGVLEACAEVDNEIRKRTSPLRLASSMSLVQELLQYLGEDVVFVPDLDMDSDVNRLERPANTLNKTVWDMREKLLKGLEKQNLWQADNKCKRFASLLDPCRSREDVVSGAVWEQLEAEYNTTAAAMAVNRQTSEASGSSNVNSQQDLPADEIGSKRKWKGTLKERKERLMSKGSDCQQRAPAEIQTYRSMAPLPSEGFDALSWWAERGRAKAEAHLGAAGAAPVLPRLAARYHSADPTSCQASALFGHLSFRMAGLHAMEPIHRIETMLLVRLNRALITGL